MQLIAYSHVGTDFTSLFRERRFNVLLMMSTLTLKECTQHTGLVPTFSYAKMQMTSEVTVNLYSQFLVMKDSCRLQVFSVRFSTWNYGIFLAGCSCFYSSCAIVE
jgi:hypothetical protein